MLNYLKNLGIGLVIVSLLAGIVVLVLNLFNFIYDNYNFNSTYAAIIVAAILLTHLTSLLGKYTLKYLKK